MNKAKLTWSVIVAAIATVIFITAITIGAELWPSLKDWLKNFSGHHWTSKSILAMFLMLGATGLGYFWPGEFRGVGPKRSLNVLLAVVWLGAVAIIGFFTWHYLIAI